MHTCLSSQMNDLTVQVMKDDLIIPSAPPTHIPVGMAPQNTLPLSPPHPSHPHTHPGTSTVVNL